MESGDRVLEGRTAIVTGAGAGLGLGIARELAREGASVAVLEIDPDSGEAAARELTGLGAEARFYRTDVTSREQVDAAFEAVVRDFGRLDAAINNAGISRVGAHTHEVSDEDWQDSIAVMQTGVFYCMRAAGRILLPNRSGSVVNISSIRGFAPNVGRLTYCTPKAAVIMMTRVAAGEWAPHGVRVNAIAPGILRTPMWDADVARGAMDEGRYLDLVPVHRLGLPAEVGRLVVYLCSDAAEYVTGSCLTIDGGLTSIVA
jgi:NAD(P)-dependent dehydrogenase (short-subunit alcohol dehydrogenase family)